jgi:hypothetical protein
MSCMQVRKTPPRSGRVIRRGNQVGYRVPHALSPTGSRQIGGIC